MKKRQTATRKPQKISAYMLANALIFWFLPHFSHAENAAEFIAVPPLISTSSSGDKANVLFILDNSNSMDEAPSGQGVGSDNPGSKSEIARNAVKNIVNTFGNNARMGLMAYKQTGITKRRLHDSQYDVSYNPDNYDPTFTGDRASTTKRFRKLNPSNPGKYIYYNVALPFYSNSNNYNRFCYSSSASFDNGSEHPTNGPWDYYRCYRNKTNETDTDTGLSSRAFNSYFTPTDSDYAQNILDFGRHLTWQYVGLTWYASSNPGKGYLHVEVADVDAAQKAKLDNKLARSQFSTSTDTPLRNAGLTPIEGSLRSAGEYFSGTLPAGDSITSNQPAAPQANSCSQSDYVILVTDGLPSVDANGNILTDTQTAINQAATAAANLLSAGVRTYVVGFGLPTGVDGSLLDKIAIAGGTGATYLASDSATLNKSLETIFLSFSERETSSASSAVVSTNARGEGAIFQAIYSPKKEINGTTVNWVGNVYGLFLDEQGNFREDSNQNKTLDDYATDRVVQYYFDSDSENTRVKLFASSANNASTIPDFTNATPIATADLDDLKSLWDAKDNLGLVSDVLTQRPYSQNAASARYIISSVDGASTLDFVQISNQTIDELLAIQEAAYEALLPAEADYNDASILQQAALATIDDSIAARTEAELARDAVLASLDDTAVANLASELAEQNAALDQAETDHAQAAEDYLDNYDTRESNLGEAIDGFEDGLTELSTPSISSTDEYQALVSHLIDQGADSSDAAVTQARDALAAAEEAFDESLADLGRGIADYREEVNFAAEDIRGDIDELAENGNISESDLDGIKVIITEIITHSAGALNTANNNFSYDTLNNRRQAYIDALVATGVNTNRPGARTAIANYEAARADELSAEASLHGSFGSSVYSSTDDFFGAAYEVYNSHELIAPAEDAVNLATEELAAASAALEESEEALNEAETALTQADEDLATAESQLAPIQGLYDDMLSAYNAALTVYNQATATVNNSDTLINYLDTGSLQEAYNVVRFVRGEDGISGLRSRAIDYDNDGTNEVWRLGDIVHSSPTYVGAPREGYDSLYRDTTYAAFRKKYKDRRQMLYVGANDGMIHAFNGGFWNAEQKRFETTNAFLNNTSSTTGNGGVTAHPLGAELWAYVPRAALPHLKWMTDPKYAHSYYVDGDPITFDANIFPNDATHPGGWGTVIMIGMRFGGGAIDVDSDDDGTDDTTLSSSYVLLDITDPEQPPSLIAEISHPNLGFTTSIPTVIRKRSREVSFATPKQNDWYVAFGSGPTELNSATSTQNAGLFVYDLRTKAFVSGFDPLVMESNSFVGDIEVFDENNNYIDDTLYFGVNGGSPSSGETGLLKRTRLDVSPQLSTSTLINPGSSIIGAPGVAEDAFGERWISFGTGRLFAAPDNVTTQAQNYFGVMEPKTNGNFTWGTRSFASLQDVTNIEVLDTGKVSDNGSSLQIPSGVNVTNFDALGAAIRRHRGGWRLSLDNNGNDPSMRNVSRPDYFKNILFFTAYQPSTNACAPEGSSLLYGIDFRTGTALPSEPFAPDDETNLEGEVADSYVDLGFGMSTAPSVISNSDGVSVLTNNSIGVLERTSVNTQPFKNRQTVLASTNIKLN